MNGTKKWYMSKTLAFNIVAFIVAVLASFGYEGTLPDAWVPFVVPAVTIINLILRLITEKRLTT